MEWTKEDTFHLHTIDPLEIHTDTYCNLHRYRNCPHCLRHHIDYYSTFSFRCGKAVPCGSDNCRHPRILACPAMETIIPIMTMGELSTENKCRKRMFLSCSSRLHFEPLSSQRMNIFEGGGGNKPNFFITNHHTLHYHQQNRQMPSCLVMQSLDKKSLTQAAHHAKKTPTSRMGNQI